MSDPWIAFLASVLGAGLGFAGAMWGARKAATTMIDSARVTGEYALQTTVHTRQAELQRDTLIEAQDQFAVYRDATSQALLNWDAKPSPPVEPTAPGIPPMPDPYIFERFRYQQYLAGLERMGPASTRLDALQSRIKDEEIRARLKQYTAEMTQEILNPSGSMMLPELFEQAENLNELFGERIRNS